MVAVGASRSGGAVKRASVGRSLVVEVMVVEEKVLECAVSVQARPTGDTEVIARRADVIRALTESALASQKGSALFRLPLNQLPFATMPTIWGFNLHEMAFSSFATKALMANGYYLRKERISAGSLLRGQVYR